MASLTLGEKILKYLENCNGVDSMELATQLEEAHQNVVGAIKSLQSLNMINVEQKCQVEWSLTDEGLSVIEKGSIEAVVYRSIPPEGLLYSQIMKICPKADIGFNKAMSAGWIQMDRSGGYNVVKKKVECIQDIVQEDMECVLNNDISPESEKRCQEYKKRKLLRQSTIKTYYITRGTAFDTLIVKQHTEITPEMIATGSWKDKTFKPYNFDALGVQPEEGYLHPLLKVRSEIRQIFLEMGFTEMATNNYVENCFWNFDALFQPQHHPARDAQDTFFLTDPPITNTFPFDYLERVEKIHSVGGFGSQGYGCRWSIHEACKNILRTHTTAVSARHLYNIATEGFRPVKLFSIDRVFRNETFDATHLAEFHQIEGVVADHNLTLGNLQGILYEFFMKLGIKELKFKPTYNPYTEPSMEIMSYHNGLGRWIEIGNSGIFRPEMVLPMGIPRGVNVIAWGLSLERPTMIMYGIKNIHDLLGHKINLKMVQTNPICRLKSLMG